MTHIEIKNILTMMNNSESCLIWKKELKMRKIDARILEQLLLVYSDVDEKLRVINLLVSNGTLSRCTYNNLFDIMSTISHYQYDTLIKLLDPYIDGIDNHTFMMILSLYHENCCQLTIILYLFNKVTDMNDIFISQMYSKINSSVRDTFLDEVIKIRRITPSLLVLLLNYDHNTCDDITKIKMIQTLHKNINMIDEHNAINIIDMIHDEQQKKRAIDMLIPLLPIFTLTFIFNCAIDWSGDLKIYMITIALNKNIIKSRDVINILKWLGDDFKIKAFKMFVTKGIITKNIHDEILDVIPQCNRGSVDIVLKNIKYKKPLSDVVSFNNKNVPKITIKSSFTCAIEYHRETVRCPPEIIFSDDETRFSFVIDHDIIKVTKIIIKSVSRTLINVNIITTQGSSEISFKSFDDVKKMLHQYLPNKYFLKHHKTPPPTFLPTIPNIIILDFYVIELLGILAILDSKYRIICNVIDWFLV